MEQVAILSHIADIDGIGAAALVKMKYKMPAANAFFTGHSVRELSYAEKGLGPLYKKGILLFITDLTPGPKTIPMYARIIKNVKAHGGEVVIFDHHTLYKEAVSKIAKKSSIAIFGENKEMCATELVKKYTGLDTKFAREFAHVVHHADFYIQLKEKRHSRLVDDYSMSLGYINMGQSYWARIKRLRRIVDLLSSGKFTDRELKGLAIKFRKLNHDRITKMLKSLYLVSNKIAVGFTKQVDSTEACMKVIAKAHVGISVVVNLDHDKGSIRSTDKDIVKLANAFGGGGHPHAAGFNIDAKQYNFFKTGSDKDKFVKNVESAARNIGLL